MNKPRTNPLFNPCYARSDKAGGIPSVNDGTKPWAASEFENASVSDSEKWCSAVHKHAPDAFVELLSNTETLRESTLPGEISATPAVCPGVAECRLGLLSGGVRIREHRADDLNQESLTRFFYRGLFPLLMD